MLDAIVANESLFDPRQRLAARSAILCAVQILIFAMRTSHDQNYTRLRIVPEFVVLCDWMGARLTVKSLEPILVHTRLQPLTFNGNGAIFPVRI